MKSFLINISVLLLLFQYAQAQNDSVRVIPDSLKGQKYLPTGIRLGTDVISLARNQYDDSFNGWEVNADVDFDRFFLAMDYGMWERMYPGDSNSYNNDGKYWRVGVDVNFLTKDPERNMFFLGLRYGRSNFSESLFTIQSDPNWGDVAQNYSNTNINARWLELTGGLKIKIWKYIWLGYTARFKFGLKMGDTPTMLPHDVPGYGRTDKETYWGFNYQVFFRIPVRKQPRYPVVEKGK